MPKFFSRPETKVLAACLVSFALSLPAYYYRLDIPPLELTGILFLAVALDPWWAAVAGLILATIQGLVLRVDYFYYISLYVMLGLYWGCTTRMGLARVIGQDVYDSRRRIKSYLKFLGLFATSSIFAYAILKTLLQLLLFRNPGQNYSDKLFYFYSNYLSTGKIIPVILQTFVISLPFMLLLIIGEVYLIARWFTVTYLKMVTQINKEDLRINRLPVLWYLFGLMFSLICFLALEGNLTDIASQSNLLNLIHAIFFWEIPLMAIGVLAYILVADKSRAGYILSIFITMLPPALIIWMILRLESEINLSLRDKIFRSLVDGRISQQQLLGILDLHLQKQLWLIGLVTVGIFAGASIILLIIYSWNKDIRASKDELEQKVIERTQKLAQAQEKLIQTEKLAVLGRLSAEVAHEVNNPLYGVINYADIVIGKSKDTPALRHYMELIRSGLYYINAILKQLGSIPATQDPKFLPTDIGQVLDQALFLMDYKITTQKIVVEKKYKPKTFNIEADAQLLQQVFINLIHNALQAMKDNGKLTISVGYLDDGRIEIKFADTGQGIPPEHVGDIFKPFFTTKKAMEGMGLGLTVCENIIKKHNGRVSVQSKLGEGTIFSIELPVSH